MARVIGFVSRTLTVVLAAFCIMTVNPACAKEHEGKKAGAVPAPKQTPAAHETQQTAARTQVVPPSQQTAPAAQQQTAAEQTGATPVVSAEKKPETKVDVYLFHGTYRCYSCNLMEELAVEAIHEQLSKEKESGTVVFHHLNVEEPHNRHFIDDYRLAAISIILSQKSGGKEKQWKNLDQVWTLLRDRERFKDYVVKEIRNYLKG